MGVSFSDKEGDEHTYYILGVWDQDDDLNIISASESGLAKALLGSKNGDTVVVPDGEVQVKKVMPLSNSIKELDSGIIFYLKIRDQMPKNTRTKTR